MPETIEKELRMRRAGLMAELERLISPPREGSSVAFGKRIGDGTTEAVERIATTAAARSIAASISATDRALEKLEDGTYGVCDRCGTEIASARLQALPASSHCVECAKTG